MIFQDSYFYVNDLNCHPFGNRWNEKIQHSRVYAQPEERKYVSTCVCMILVDIYTHIKKKKVTSWAGGSITLLNLWCYHWYSLNVIVQNQKGL